MIKALHLGCVGRTQRSSKKLESKRFERIAFEIEEGRQYSLGVINKHQDGIQVAVALSIIAQELSGALTIQSIDLVKHDRNQLNATYLWGRLKATVDYSTGMLVISKAGNWLYYGLLSKPPILNYS
jgi:hypothetical protein